MIAGIAPRLKGLAHSDLGPYTRELLGSVVGGIDEVVVFSIPLNIRFRGVTHREGLLLRGRAGWGECAPFWGYQPPHSSKWLTGALATATTKLPLMQRDFVPVNVTIPVCSAEEVRRRIDDHPGCSTAKVKVADAEDSRDLPASPDTLGATAPLGATDLQRVQLVAELLADRYGPQAALRIDANAAWNVEQARQALDLLNRAAAPVGGIQYAEQPCATALDLARLRQLTDVPIAADESIRLADDTLAVKKLDAADVAILKVSPLGGIRKALEISSQLGLPSVVSSAIDTSIGLAAGTCLAAALPDLTMACGLGTGSMLATDVVDDSLIADEGHLNVDQAMAILSAPLSKCAEALDVETSDAWADRLEEMTKFLVQENSGGTAPW